MPRRSIRIKSIQHKKVNFECVTSNKFYYIRKYIIQRIGKSVDIDIDRHQGQNWQTLLNVNYKAGENHSKERSETDAVLYTCVARTKEANIVDYWFWGQSGNQ